MSRAVSRTVFRTMLVCACLLASSSAAAEGSGKPPMRIVRRSMASSKMAVFSEESTGTGAKHTTGTAAKHTTASGSTTTSSSHGITSTSTGRSSSRNTQSQEPTLLAPRPHAVPELTGAPDSAHGVPKESLGPAEAREPEAALTPSPAHVESPPVGAEGRPEHGIGSVTSSPPPGDSAASAPSPGSSVSSIPGDWHPRPGKFLLAYCLFGRLSNEIYCMRSYLKVAQVTNRVLLIPTWNDAINVAYTLEYSFPWDVPVDWARMAKCLEPGYGPQTVMTVKQYLKQYKKNTVNVTFFRSLHNSRRWAIQEPVAEREFRRINPELSFPPVDSILETGLVQHIEGPPSPEAVAAAAAAITDDVMSFGELFNFDFDRPLPPLRVADKACSNLWRPHPGIVEFVHGLISTKIKGAYGAVHLRRGDFYGYMTDWGKTKLPKAEFLSIAEAAGQMREWLRNDNITRLFIATNARRHELEMYKALVQEPSEGHQVEVALSLKDVLHDTDWLKKQRWAKAALELDKLPGSGGIVWSIVDKFMCVHADRFYGSSRSTFSGEIDWILRPDEARAK